jgi:hypothetical protein
MQPFRHAFRKRPWQRLVAVKASGTPGIAPRR